MFASVARTRDAESELEIKCLEQAITEKVTLDHPEIAHRLVPNRELHPGIYIKREIVISSRDSSSKQKIKVLTLHRLSEASRIQA